MTATDIAEHGVGGRAGLPPATAGPRRRARAAWGPYLLLLPAVAALTGMLLYPVVRVVLTSFQQLGLRELVHGDTVWVGLSNYRHMLGSPSFWTITLRTALFTAACVTATMSVGLLLAVAMRGMARSVRLGLQTAMVLAWATPIIATTTVFQWLFDENYGIVDKTFAGIGFSGMRHHAWFTSGLSAFFVIGLLVTWQAIPFVSFGLYAALLAVPDELTQAAHVDGAGSVRTLVSIHWPAVRPLFAMLTFLSMIWDFKVFTQIYVVRAGGPSGKTTTISIYQYTQGIAHSQFGLAAAASVFMIVVLMLVSAVYVRMLMRAPEPS